MLNQRKTLLVLLRIASFIAVSEALWAQQPLIVNGIAQAAVVVSEEAGASEKHAAEELSFFLGQVTGVPIQVVNQNSDTAMRLLVGCRAAQSADKDFSTAGLGNEGIVIRTVGQDLILAGGQPRGTLYAVYTFLEDIVGCRWWAPGESTIPYKPDLWIPAMDVRYVPIMEFREPYWGNYLADGDWSARNKINGGRVQADVKQGGNVTEIGSVHSFYVDFPPEKYFKDHPDWYSEINGVRTGDNAQLCMTNESLIAAYAAFLAEQFRTHPGVSSAWVSQNDWGNHCQCEKCRRINEEQDTPAGALILFVNAIAAEVEKLYPEAAIRTLAYDWSQKPPKTIKPRHNVVVWLCTTGCKYNVPYTHPINQTFRDHLDGWGQIHNRIYIWDYPANYSAYLCPHPNLRTLGPNIKYFSEHGVRGVFSQGAYSAPGAQMDLLRAWVTAKLMWNPTLNDQKLIDEFLDGYFGPAGRHIRAYLDAFETAIDATGEFIYMIEHPIAKKWLGLETLSNAMGHMLAAKKSVQGEAELTKRVEIAELSLLYPFMVRWDELYEESAARGTAWPLGEETLEQVFQRFETMREKYNVPQISEKNERDVFESVRERIAAGKPAPPPGCETLPRSHWAVIQESGFNRNQYVTGIAADADASNGYAVQMPGGPAQKMIHKQTRRIPLVYYADAVHKPIRVKLSVRCELLGKEGIAFQYGMDTQNRTVEVRADQIADGGYHTYDLGLFDTLTGWGSIWLGPADNAENVKTIKVDRMWLVLEE